MIDMIKFKPHLNDLIKFYYKDLENPTGGYLHVALDDGNLTENDIWFCQERSKEHGDTLGYFLATLMRSFAESELLDLYEKDWWNMK